MVGLLIRWVLLALALWITAVLLPHFVTITSPVAALVAALLLSLVNAIVRPLLILFTLPFTLMTLGLFLFVINAATFGLAALLSGPGFQVHGFLGALVGSVVVTVISWILNAIVGDRGKVEKVKSGY